MLSMMANKKKIVKISSSWILCPGCKAGQLTMDSLILHVADVHGQTLQKLSLKFSSTTDFQSWKEAEETENNCKFNCFRSSLKKRTKLLLCHRSGLVKKNVDVLHRKKDAKQFGSCKMNATCTAHMRVKENDGEISVTYFKQHYGHFLADQNQNNFTTIKPSRIRCPGCKAHHPTMDSLILHVADVHDKTIKKLSLKFSSTTDFQSWKEEEEKKNSCRFVCRDSSLKRRTKLFLCHRSGLVKKNVDVLHRKKDAKQFGSCKMNATCTAHMRVKENDGEISVTYFKQHYGHFLADRNQNNFTTIKPSRIRCPGCKAHHPTMDSLILHVADVHDKTIKKLSLKFSSITDFQSWKEEEEKENNCQFLNTSSKKNRSRTKLFLCNRSGFFETKVDVLKRKRRAKQIGSCKMNATCTAHIRVKENDGEISVSYFKEHYGHQCDPRYLRISKEDKAFFAGKIQQGIPMKKIIRDARTERKAGKIRRLDIINRKDLLNICNQFGVSPTQTLTLHQYDTVSVEAWVEGETYTVSRDSVEPTSPVQLDAVESTSITLPDRIAKVNMLRESFTNAMTAINENLLTPAAIDGIMDHMKVINKLMLMNDNTPMQNLVMQPTAEKEPVNKSIKKQIRFKSIKKKKSKKESALTGPKTERDTISARHLVLHGETLNIINKAGQEHIY